MYETPNGLPPLSNKQRGEAFRMFSEGGSMPVEHDPARVTLKMIVEQLEMCAYECQGGLLANNVYFQFLKMHAENLEPAPRVGDLVAFHGGTDGGTLRRVLQVDPPGSPGMIEVEGMGGYFAIHLFRVFERAKA
jgi:hypothetical protein